jgi:hypothetical protein
MMQPILEASPSFEPVWREFVAEWKDHPDGLPHYLVLSDLARHIAGLLEQDADSELRQIFHVVEAWHLDGDEYAREAATVGLLEDLQNTNVVGDDATAECLGYLGPESAHWITSAWGQHSARVRMTLARNPTFEDGRFLTEHLQHAHQLFLAPGLGVVVKLTAAQEALLLERSEVSSGLFDARKVQPHQVQRVGMRLHERLEHAAVGREHSQDVI